MLFIKTLLKPSDNSGAKLFYIIQIPMKSKKNQGTLGDLIRGVIKKSKPKGKGKVYKKTVQKAIILKIKRILKRKNGWYLKFFSNGILILNKRLDMIATRIKTIIPKETRVFKKTQKIKGRVKIFYLMKKFYI